MLSSHLKTDCREHEEMGECICSGAGKVITHRWSPSGRAGDHTSEKANKAWGVTKYLKWDKGWVCTQTGRSDIKQELIKTWPISGTCTWQLYLCYTAEKTFLSSPSLLPWLCCFHSSAGLNIAVKNYPTRAKKEKKLLGVQRLMENCEKCTHILYFLKKCLTQCNAYK